MVDDLRIRVFLIIQLVNMAFKEFEVVLHVLLVLLGHYSLDLLNVAMFTVIYNLELTAPAYWLLSLVELTSVLNGFLNLWLNFFIFDGLNHV